jgi:hypothetical protein
MNNLIEDSIITIEQLLDAQAQLLEQLEHGPKSAAWQAGYNAGLAMAEKWRPIETAPKDSTPVLLGWYETWPNLEWITESAAAGNSDIARQGAGYLHGYATHWMPLPKPPVISAGKEVSDE